MGLSKFSQASKTSKRFLAVLLLLSSGAFASLTDATTTTQNTTGSAPTLVTQGASMAGAKKYRVTISAESGQTLSGAGSELCYFWNIDLARWARCSTLLDISLTGISGVRDYTATGFIVDVPRGRIFYMPSGVTVSGGTTVNVSIEMSRDD